MDALDLNADPDDSLLDSPASPGSGRILIGDRHRVDKQALAKDEKIADILKFLYDTKCSCASDHSISDGELAPQGGAR